MRSLQVTRYIPVNERRHYSELQVLKSAAGYYIGTIFTDPKYRTFQETGSRDSCYFPTEEEAKIALAKLEEFGPNKIQKWEVWLILTGQDPNCVGYRYTP